MRTIKHEADANGRELVRVPLDNDGILCATLYEEDFQALIDKGLSPKWSFDTKHGKPVVWVQDLHKHVPVARLVTNAGPGEYTIFIDGNSLNLRSDNLTLGNGTGKQRERDFIRPTRRDRKDRLMKHVTCHKQPADGAVI
jgi:hypothetical protein